ncbi:hypothetical protein KPH14_009832 [Odynerus spinipes]|uniref:E3 ubiquitin-protein ligase Sina-like RING finger domain-containing protein n=1 Tax=Odynerus spinipes TaxID=1348599 RepID=A0AAD9VUW2_9HYME|nr:hypothetical protein KPH14_009832 [Odynerus spinipes]
MSMLVETRTKWCDILESLLECPVCCEIPESYIYQCKSGHHICQNCRYKLAICPICGFDFSYTRNYLAEALSVSLKDIMTSLMYPTHKINRRILENKICVHTQTQEISKTSVEVQTGNIFFVKNMFTQTNKIDTDKQRKREDIGDRKILEKAMQ